MNKRQILTAAVLAVGGFGIAALPVWAQDSAAQQEKSQQPAAQGQAGQQQTGAQEGQRDSGAAAQTAGERQAGDSAQSGQTDQARRALSETSQAITSKDGARSLSQLFSRADQQRLGDMTQQAQQVNQAGEQLRQAYKEKYQKDLDLSANAGEVFTTTMFRVSPSGQDAARQASGRVAPDAAGTAGAGVTSPDSGAAAASSDAPARRDAGGIADQAQPAAGSTPQQMTVLISGSAGAPEGRIQLIQEGGQWKIDVPDSMDANQLSQKLTERIQRSTASKDQWPADATQAQQAIARDVLLVFADPAAAGQSGADRSGAGTSDSGTSGAGASGATGAGSTGAGSTGAGSTGAGTGGTAR